MTKQRDCEHLDFSTSVIVNRIANTPHIVADITIFCADCGLPFLFLGPVGVAFDRPSVSADGQELRAPIAPTWTHKAVAQS